MNYRHIYHAGNFADVMKHSILALLLEALGQKDKSYFALDSHAGQGLYDLKSAAALKTGEQADGIGRVFDHRLPELAPYLDAIRAVNAGLAPDQPPRNYPGSPRLIRHFMRPGDRLAAVELHAEDQALLREEFTEDKQVGVHHQDAYVALRALLPPKERRGLVFIDPPFEADQEFSDLLAGLEVAYPRFANGIFAIWYPIQDRLQVDRFYRAIVRLGIQKVFVAEIQRSPEAHGLRGCGLMIINPPWKSDQTIERLLTGIGPALGFGEEGRKTRWLVPEKRRKADA